MADRAPALERDEVDGVARATPPVTGVAAHRAPGPDPKPPRRAATGAAPLPRPAIRAAGPARPGTRPGSGRNRPGSGRQRPAPGQVRLPFAPLPALPIEPDWKVQSRLWGHAYHPMCSYLASFPAALAHAFIARYTRPGDVVLDPFSGRGTTPLQACAEGRIGVGNDLDPWRTS